MPSVQSNVIASIAPSAAPAETPSVNGVASGLRSSPWNTTPAVASAAPTSAPASVRGRRATKKICASTLSANGIDRSNARRRLIDVDPTSGASTIAASASSPKPMRGGRDPAPDRHARVPGVYAPQRHDHEVAGAGVRLDLGLDAVERADVAARQHLGRRSGREHLRRPSGAPASGTGRRRS